eukprot:scaffold549_cov385-Prasinococcus_capsulatus_cf.AAC.27
MGLTPVMTVGSQFDPNLMDAIQSVPTAEATEGTVLQEFRMVGARASSWVIASCGRRWCKLLRHRPARPARRRERQWTQPRRRSRNHGSGWLHTSTAIAQRLVRVAATTSA